MSHGKAGMQRMGAPRLASQPPSAPPACALRCHPAADLSVATLVRGCATQLCCHVDNADTVHFACITVGRKQCVGTCCESEGAAGRRACHCTAGRPLACKRRAVHGEWGTRCRRTCRHSRLQRQRKQRRCSWRVVERWWARWWHRRQQVCNSVNHRHEPAIQLPTIRCIPTRYLQGSKPERGQQVQRARWATCWPLIEARLPSSQLAPHSTLVPACPPEATLHAPHVDLPAGALPVDAPPAVLLPPLAGREEGAHAVQAVHCGTGAAPGQKCISTGG